MTSPLGNDRPVHVVSGADAIRAAYQEDARADDYIRSRYENDPFGRATHEHQVRRLSTIISSLRPERLLEVATGPARLTVHVPRIGRGIGIEQSPAMIRVATERLRAFGRDDWEIRQGDAFALPFRSREFDLAMSFKLVRHFDREDRLRLLRGFRDAVRPGGHVVIDVANERAYRWLHAKWGVEQGWIDDYWFTAESFLAEAADAGFVNVELHPIQPWILGQYYCWSHVWRRSPAAARGIGRLLERVPWGEPLEWMAVCRCA